MTTSAPASVAPSAKAAASAGEVGPHVVADDDRRRAGHLGVRAAGGAGQCGVDLLGSQASDVVGLEHRVDGRRVELLGEVTGHAASLVARARQHRSPRQSTWTGAHQPVRVTSLLPAAAAEAVGTGFLVMAVVGSGIAAVRRSPDDAGLQLLENSLVTGAALVALILALQPVSASFNPVVTLVERGLGRVDTRTALALSAAQVAGGARGWSWPT